MKMNMIMVSLLVIVAGNLVAATPDSVRLNNTTNGQIGYMVEYTGLVGLAGFLEAGQSYIFPVIRNFGASSGNEQILKIKVGNQTVADFTGQSAADINGTNINV